MIKRNNPGNIEKGKNKWIGEIESDGSRFATFKNLVFGYRAMIKLIQTYISRGNNTISKIIPIYAPPSENPTENYIQFVTSASGIPRNEPLEKSDLERIGKIVLAMSVFEHGLKGNEISSMKPIISDSIRILKDPSSSSGNINNSAGTPISPGPGPGYKPNLLDLALLAFSIWAFFQIPKK